MTRHIAFTVAALALGASLHAQEQGAPLETGRTHRIASRVLGEERVYHVALPTGYQRGNERYPVIVVLDGEAQHDVAAGIARFYASTSMMPTAIVVGIRNTQRARDFTPAPAGDFRVPPEAENAGGADRFLDFLDTELLPHLDRTYRTAPMRVLVGHSLGGLLAIHALAQRPSLFTGYVVMEPSIWWNGEGEWRRAAAQLRAPAARRARVMLVNTPRLDVDTTRWGGDAAMVRHILVPDETHASMAAAGMLQAFRTLFADFRPAQWKPGTRPVAMLDRYDSLRARVGYPVPIPESAYERTIIMSVHARHFDDAERMVTRMAADFPGSTRVTGLRDMLREERAAPIPAGLIPLEIPSRRPSPSDARAFLGRWTVVGSERGHEVEIAASGDTIVVHSRVQFPDGSWDAGDRHVIQVTTDGTLEWGLPWFRGIAALLVQKARIQPDGSMRVEREPRGWVPRDPNASAMLTADVFRRVAAGNPQ